MKGRRIECKENQMSSKRSKNCTSQQSGTPHHLDITSQQTHPIFDTNQCRQLQQHNSCTNCPTIMAHKMYMPTNNMSMPSQIKTVYSEPQTKHKHLYCPHPRTQINSLNSHTTTIYSLNKLSRINTPNTTH